MRRRDELKRTVHTCFFLFFASKAAGLNAEEGEEV